MRSPSRLRQTCKAYPYIAEDTELRPAMSDPTHATSGLSSDVVFRMLAPVFMYEIQGATCFDHAGQFNNCKFQVALQPYNHRTDFDEVTKTADTRSRDMLQ